MAEALSFRLVRFGGFFIMFVGIERSKNGRSALLLIFRLRLLCKICLINVAKKRPITISCKMVIVRSLKKIIQELPAAYGGFSVNELAFALCPMSVHDYCYYGIIYF